MSALDVGRELARWPGGRPGRTLLCVGGLHGNEPAGVEALRRVVERLRPRAGALAGHFVALTGNRAALRAGCRYLHMDLNRAWTPERVTRLQEPGARAGTEDVEQAELLALLGDLEAEADGPLLVLDLHTTSSPGGAFATVSASAKATGFADAFPAPGLLGLGECLQGTMLDHLGERGHVTLGFEGGEHGDPASVDRLEAATWIAVWWAGLLPAEELPELGPARERLRRDTGHLPRWLEVRYRHAIHPGDEFRMRPGYRNFQPVRQGEVLAHDRSGDVRAPLRGRVLMPLYQEMGTDGFFLVREVEEAVPRVGEVEAVTGPSA